MKPSSEFVDNLHEVFALFGPISARRMFGGYGIYHDGLMFALVADDVLYLKADPVAKAAFVDLGLPPFEYMKNGKSTKMSYHLAPEEIYDDPEAARDWAKLAYGAALRAARAKAHCAKDHRAEDRRAKDPQAKDSQAKDPQAIDPQGVVKR